MKTAIILVDNLRIGGFQRLALDQAYRLSEKDYSVTILVLDELPNGRYPSFMEAETNLISNFGISIVSIGTSRIRQMINLLNLAKKQNSKTLLLSHSLRATFLLSLVNLKFNSRLRPISTIHQLPTLSKPRQRMQRFVYAQFSWKLLAYSNAVKLDWETRIDSNPILKNIIARKGIQTVRNGIYLNRLPARASGQSSDGPPRLIFLGRVTSWKGVETFLNIIQNPKLSEFEILFIVPESKDVDLNSLSRHLLLRTTVLDGKPISAYKPRLGDVHIYPANYGTDAKYIESVSLNCLELACLGVPTLLSKGGLSTWPDLSSLEIFHETEWRNLNQIALEILRISNIRFSDEIIHKVRNEVDIRNQIDLLTALLV